MLYRRSPRRRVGHRVQSRRRLRDGRGDVRAGGLRRSLLRRHDDCVFRRQRLHCPRHMRAQAHRPAGVPHGARADAHVLAVRLQPDDPRLDLRVLPFVHSHRGQPVLLRDRRDGRRVLRGLRFAVPDNVELDDHVLDVGRQEDGAPHAPERHGGLQGHEGDAAPLPRRVPQRQELGARRRRRRPQEGRQEVGRRPRLLRCAQVRRQCRRERPARVRHGRRGARGRRERPVRVDDA
mmetsp:Transcript_13239/g.35141  ORF Transcript_13239/g.35141 Transcript_13239/m.35141 type:complete len:235 (-) Transcript_13239:1034-1738(-)